jgi:hypothetical protein
MPSPVRDEVVDQRDLRIFSSRESSLLVQLPRRLVMGRAAVLDRSGDAERGAPRFLGLTGDELADDLDESGAAFVLEGLLVMLVQLVGEERSRVLVPPMSPARIMHRRYRPIVGRIPAGVA